MSDPEPQLTELFRDEAVQRLDEMDAALLAIESGTAGQDTVGELFRNAHTIKGAAGMVGFDDIGVLAHAVEDVLAVVRESGEFPPALAAPLLRATSTLRTHVGGQGEPIEDIVAELSASRAALLAGEPDDADSAPAAGPAGTGPADVPPEPAPGGGAPAAADGSTPPVADSSAAPSASGSAAPDASGSAAPSASGSAAPGDAGATGPTPPAGGSATSPPVSRDVRDTGQGVRRPGSEQHTLRVPAGKIDYLLDLVGEIMQDRRRLAHTLGEEAGLPTDVADQLSAGDRMLDDLKDSAVGMRTLPLGAITGPLPRAVRDLARSAGKEVEFAVTGADTELDRVILESLSEPLAHLLRNCVIHGIEARAERERAGKPPGGRIELRAVPRGSLVEISVVDDGRGVSPAVFDEARREGSLGEVLARPGYSTAAEVTDLAGRGVGLDAVKTHVQSLGGSFEVRSEPGRGMEIVLLLPLALALLNVLLFGRGGAVYGVPLAAVEEVVTAAPTLSLEGRLAFDLRGRPLPVADIASLLGAAAPPLGDHPPGLVLSASGRRLIVTCDELLGEEEVVVKSLGPLLAFVAGYLGAAILGDGRIALLLEPAALTRGSRQSAGAKPSTAEPAAAPKILVAEDSFTVRELQRSILEAAGYRVATARDGREALEVLGGDTDIALVLSDLEMPELDGLGLTRAIRADAARSSLPVVIVTSRGSEEDRRKGIEAGADAYMAKQRFDQQALLATVERLVGRSRGQAAARR